MVSMIWGIVLVRVGGFETLFFMVWTPFLKRVLMYDGHSGDTSIFCMGFDGFDTALMALERFLFMVWARFFNRFWWFWGTVFVVDLSGFDGIFQEGFAKNRFPTRLGPYYGGP